MRYLVLAYYRFVTLEDPHLEVQKHQAFFEGRDISGRIYLSEEGINGQISGARVDAKNYMDWLSEDPRFSDIHFKIHEHHENIFPRMTVKYRRQLVAMDCSVDVTQGGEHVSPEKWKKMLKDEKDEQGIFLLDVRNRYEWEIGHFDGAGLPPLENFREFPEYAEQLKKEVDPEQIKVMMYCTGGIRCELFSALLKEKGFKNVYQLEGGIINYGLKEGSEHWKGKLFVFDDRLTVSIDGKECEPISNCCHCHLPIDVYYNCANMDCNELFLACHACIETYKGCCSFPCKTAERVRPFKPERGNKPFRRKHILEASE
jgi:UPF0176 protein